jgi:hypothetical protein
MVSNTLSSPKNRTTAHFVVLDSSKAFRQRLGEQNSVQVSKKSDLLGTVDRSSAETVWIVGKSGWAELLLEAVSCRALQQQRKMVFGDVLMLEPVPRLELLPPLYSQFRRVVGEVPEFRMLPGDQLADVLSSKNKADLFVGGIVDRRGGTITLARGDLATVTVPLSIFNTEGRHKPAFSRFEVDDYGYALRFGEYEASAHSVLYRIDPAYRRRSNERRIAEERGFGPSLRRLRIIRHLSRSDFPGISPKTLARIERGETAKPQGKTLDNLAKRLEVEAKDIETY